MAAALVATPFAALGLGIIGTVIVILLDPVHRQPGPLTPTRPRGACGTPYARRGRPVPVRWKSSRRSFS